MHRTTLVSAHATIHLHPSSFSSIYNSSFHLVENRTTSIGPHKFDVTEVYFSAVVTGFWVETAEEREREQAVPLLPLAPSTRSTTRIVELTPFVADMDQRTASHEDQGCERAWFAAAEVGDINTMSRVLAEQPQLIDATTHLHVSTSLCDAMTRVIAT